MPVEINEFELLVENQPPAGATSAAGRPSPLPSPQQDLRDAWMAARRAELEARWAAFDRDDER